MHVHRYVALWRSPTPSLATEGRRRAHLRQLEPCHAAAGFPRMGAPAACHWVTAHLLAMGEAALAVRGSILHLFVACECVGRVPDLASPCAIAFCRKRRCPRPATPARRLSPGRSLPAACEASPRGTRSASSARFVCAPASATSRGVGGSLGVSAQPRSTYICAALSVTYIALSGPGVA